MQEIGPYIIFSHEDGDFELAIEAMIRRLVQAHGLPLDHITNIAIKNVAKEKILDIQEKLKKEGFPENIKKLFDAKKKKDAENIIKGMSISNVDIARMVFNSDQIGFKHSRKHKWFYPEDVIHTKQEKEAFAEKAKVGPIIDKNVQKFVTKLFEQFEKRKYISAHLLEKGDEWHMFFFDFNDAFVPHGSNHFEHGPHIHYVSHHWGKHIEKDAIWKEIDVKQTQIKSVHIKYVHI